MPAPRKKLIEVDIPLDDINRESKRERAIRHGHPSTLHQWWARLSLGACRAVIFASMVDDPSDCPEFTTKDAQDSERERLHEIIRELVKWENTDETKLESRDLIARARAEIARSVASGKNQSPPDISDPAQVLGYLKKNALPIYDPFAGGGSIPLETQRLGLRAVASDLNPVAVLINKALIEIPPKFAAEPPVNPKADSMGMKTGKMVGRGKNRKPEVVAWRGAAGLANDIRYYGHKMREMAFDRIGHLYPKAKLPNDAEATVIAWIWARTIPCPNPACGADMPLVKTFQLSTKANNRHYAKPVVNRNAGGTSVSFEVQNHSGGVPSGGTVGRNGANCVACDSSVSLPYIRECGKAGEIREQMIAIVAEGNRKRLFLSATDEHVDMAQAAEPAWRPTGKLPNRGLGFNAPLYGFVEWHQFFTERQLVALTTLSDLMPEIHALVVEHGASSAYANAVCTYLALAIGRNANASSNFSTWQNAGDFVSSVFKLPGLPMVWDFAEVNPFSTSTNNWMAQVDWVSRIVKRLPRHVNAGQVHQADASTTVHADAGPVIVTDPPYYDNVSYSDLSDFFYVWLRPLARDMYPNLFSGIATPKSEEMIAEPYRFENPRERFESLLHKTFRLIRQRASADFPSSIFYAYKQQEEKRDGRTSTGWETMLSALVNADFRIVGTWPMRTTGARVRGANSNALASSVVLVCRPRPEDAPMASRRQFIADLKREMPARLAQLESVVAPADREQSAIGPGMEIYSRYSRVETAGGRPVTVGEALALINNQIQEYDDREEGSFDPPTRFCMAWLKQHGWGDGEYGVAEVLAQAKNVVIETLRDDHRLLTAGGGSVRLCPPDSYAPNGESAASVPTTAWAAYHQMAWHFGSDPDAQRHAGAAAIARNMSPDLFDSVRRLEQALYAYYDRRGDARSALQFNALGAEWDRITIEKDKRAPQQAEQTRLMR